jgi:hypothetical protein
MKRVNSRETGFNKCKIAFPTNTGRKTLSVNMLNNKTTQNKKQINHQITIMEK